MVHSTTTRSRVARAGFMALLMSSAATAALAAPKHHHPRANPNAGLVAEVKELRAEVESLKATVATQAQTQAQQQSQTQAQQAQIDTHGQQLAEVKQTQDAATADIISLKAAPSGATVIPTLPNGKPAFATADGRFTANVRAIVMFDTGKYLQQHNLPAAVGSARDLNSGTNFRRARFGIDGKLFKDFDYALIYEFGGSGAEDAGHIQEAWAQYTALKPWRIRLGAFEPNIGLAAAVSTSQMPLLERPSPAEIARNVAAGDSRSAIQVAGNGVFGQGDSGLAARWFTSTAFTGNTVGTINSSNVVSVASTPTTVVVGTQQPFGEQTAWIGRAAIAPFQSNDWQAHFGVNYQYVFNPNDIGGIGNAGTRYPVQLRDRPELRLDGSRLIDTGAIDARHISVLGGEAGVTFQNFLLEGEYFKWDVERRSAGGNPNFDGWYVQGVWVITGESRPYNPAEARFDAPKMAYNFNPAAGTWGTWELAARYSDTDLNWHSGAAGAATPAGGIRGGLQKIASVGINWYLNPDIRFMLDYSHVDVNRLNSTGVQIGQKFNTIALRSQLTF